MATSCEEPIGDMDSYRTALNNLACALSSIKTELEGIREQATTGGEIRDRETEARQAFTNACSALTNDRDTKDPVTKAAEEFFSPPTPRTAAPSAR